MLTLKAKAFTRISCDSLQASFQASFARHFSRILMGRSSYLVSRNNSQVPEPAFPTSAFYQQHTPALRLVIFSQIREADSSQSI